MAQLVLATCQFCIQKDVNENLRSVLRQMKKAKARGAQLAHFSEACLSGYLGSELKSASESHWTKITQGMLQVMSLARELRLWVVIGCNHRLSGNHKPHNSLYVIDNRGKLVTRYDKMFCCGNHDDSQDLKYYTHSGRVFRRLQGRACSVRAPDFPRLSLPGTFPGVQKAGNPPVPHFVSHGRHES